MTTQYERLEVSRLIRAAPEKVFAAWTNPELIVRWWGAGGVRCVAAEMDLTVGGAYRIANQTPDGMAMWITGTFSCVEPPTRLAYTWAMEPIDALTLHSEVAVLFDEVEEGTVVTVTHTCIPNSETRQVNLAGWLGCLEGLDDLIQAEGSSKLDEK